MQFDPAYFRVAGVASLSLAMDYVIRTSADNPTTVYDGAFWNPSTARNQNSYHDMEIDLSSMPEITGPVTFRLYFKDDDNLVSAVSSNASWPYGWQLYGEASAVPEPSVAALGLVCGGCIALRRRR